MTDDDLRARLRRADPARDLPSAPPDRLARLLEDTMAAPTTTIPVRRQRPVIALAAAVLVLVVAGVGWLLLRPQDHQEAPVTAPAVQITAPGVAAKCVEPTAARLAESADFAFAGTVTGISGTVVTLEVTHVYRGAAAGQVQVAQAGDTSEQMMGSGKFETGGKYLVASSEGSMMICGYSGEADAPGLRDLYDKAFA
jgi:hypothetical protein